MFNKWSVMNLSIKGVGIFDCIFILCLIASLINIALRGSGRIRYGDAILDKEARKKSQANGKSEKRPNDILSMRFGDHTIAENSDEE